MTFYLPWYTFLGEQLRQGNIPGWNPHIFSGMPFAGDPQSGWWYFPAMFFFTILPPILAYKAFIWFHLAACAIAAYALARMLRLGPLGSFAGGLIFACLNLGASFTFTIQMQMAPWLPIMLIGVELAARKSSRRSQLMALMISAFAMSQVIAANIGQGTYYAGLFLGSYIVVRFVLFDRDRADWTWKSSARTAIIAGFWTFALAFLMSAAGLLPRLDATRRSFVLSDEYPGRKPDPNAGADPLYLAYRILDLFPQKFDLYAGGSAITLALISLALLPKQRRFIFFTILGLLSLTLSLKPTPIHDLFFLLPEFRALHSHEPARILSLFPIALAMMGALAIDQWRSFAEKRWLLVGLGIAAYAWMRILESANKPNSYLIISRTTAICAILVGFGIVMIYGLYATRRLERWRVPLQTAVAAVVLAALFVDPVGAMLLKPVGGRDAAVLTEAVSASGSGTDSGGAGEFLQSMEAESGPFRYFGFADPPQDNSQLHEVFYEPWVLPLLGNNRSMMLGLYDIQGYNPAQIVSYLHAMTATNGFQREYHEALVYAPGLGSPILDLLNVRYVIVPNSTTPFGTEPVSAGDLPPWYREVFRDESVTVYENLNALPHAWIVHDVIQLADVDALNQIGAGTIDPQNTATVESSPLEVSPAPAGAVESATVTKYSPDEVVISATAASDGMLVLSDVYDPDWSVKVDGHDAQLYAVDGVLRGVHIPAGEHTVTLRYESRSLFWGVVASIITMLGLLVFVGIEVRRRMMRSPSVRMGESA